MLARRPRRSTRTAAQATASHVRRMILLRSTPLNTSSLVPNEPPKNYDFEQSATADCCLNVWATPIQPLVPFLYNQGGVSSPRNDQNQCKHRQTRITHLVGDCECGAGYHQVHQRSDIAFAELEVGDHQSRIAGDGQNIECCLHSGIPVALLHTRLRSVSAHDARVLALILD